MECICTEIINGKKTLFLILIVRYTEYLKKHLDYLGIKAVNVWK